MDPSDNSSQKSPVGSRGFFDPAHILGPPVFPTRPPGSRDQPYLSHVPSAFSMFGQPIYQPRSPHSEFGGLGNLREGLTSPLGSPAALAHSPLSPTAGLHWPLTASVHLCNLASLGGAAWWRHARSMAGLNEYYSGTLGLTAPTFGSTSRERESSPPGFDSLYRQSQGQKTATSSSSSHTTATAASASTTTTSSSAAAGCSSSSSSSGSPSKLKRGRPKGSSNKTSLSASGGLNANTSMSTSSKYKDSISASSLLLLPQPPPLTSVPSFTHSSVITKTTTVSTSSPGLMTTTSSSAPSSSKGANMSEASSAKTESSKKKRKDDGSSSESSSSDDDDDSEELECSSSSNSDVSSGSSDSDSESDSDDKQMEQILQTKKQLEEKQKLLLKQEQQLKLLQKEAQERKMKDQNYKDQQFREHEQRMKQEQLKLQLEQHIKQQQQQLKLQKKAQAEREKALAAKIAASAHQGTIGIHKSLDLSQGLNLSSSQASRGTSQTSVITHNKSHKNKSQVTTKEETGSNVSSPTSKASASGTPIVARFRGVDYNADDSDKDSGSDSGSDSSGDSDDSQSGLSDSDTDDDTDSSDDDDSVDDDDDDENTDTDPESKSLKRKPMSTSTPTQKGKHDESRKRSGDDAHASTPSSALNSSAASTPTPAKRRRMHDEGEARAPLENGWRRQTTIRQLGPGDRLRGDVVYYAPCGKKIKTYPEVIRYLEKHRIPNVVRENFSFSVKIKVGEFLNPKPSDNGGIVYESMTEAEVKRMLVQDDPKKLRALERQLKREEKRRASQELARKAAENKMRRKMEQQEMAKRAADIKQRRKMDRQAQIHLAKEAKRQRALMAAEDRRRQKEHLKFLKQQEKIQRIEQIRMDREMRAQQLLEERELRRQQAVLLKNQERERRKHLLVMMEQERERRKQHMMLVRALEARKKAEEKERIKQEKKAEKKFNRERKLEQKRLEIQMAKELKKPIEDMKLRDNKPLPTMDRLKGVKLPNIAFADCLMVLEFLHNFGESLGLDLEDDVPTLETLQDGLLNDEDSFCEVVTLVIQLLNLTLADPGLPGNNGKQKTLLDQSVADIDIDEDNFSEILRLYIEYSNGKSHELSDLLYEVPFMALTPTQKAACLAYLVNDLVCSSRITQEIDKSIEHMSNLRRDKWIIEGKLRKMRTVQAKKFNRPMPPKPCNNDDSLMDTTMDITMDGDNSNLSGLGKKMKRDEEEDDDDDDDKDEDSDGTEVTNADDGEEETEPMSVEDMDKKIEKLTRQQSQFRNKLFEASHSLRAMSFGQDRFRRRYWVLPHAGGIYVEGMASSELPEDIEDERRHQERIDNGETEGDKHRTEKHASEKIEASVVVKNEDSTSMSVSAASTAVTGTASESQTIVKTEPQQNLFLQKPEKTEAEPNLFLQKPESFSKLSELLQVAKQGPETALDLSCSSSANNSVCETTTSTTSTTNLTPNCHSQSTPSLHTFRLNSGIPTSSPPEVNGGFVKLDSYLHKTDGHFSMSSPLTAGHVSAEQLLKGLADRPNGTKPWFSILPRMPCDESSLTRTHATPTKSMQDLPLPAFGVSAFHIPGSPFSALPGIPTSAPTLAFPGLGHTFIPMSAYGLPNSLLQTNSTSQGLPRPEDDQLQAQAHSEAIQSMKAMLADREDKEAAPIPEDLKYGWWHVTEAEIIKHITRVLHPRGIRERILQKNLLKYADFACLACSKKGSEYFKIDDEEEDEDEENENEEESQEFEIKMDTYNWSPQVMFQVHKSVLEDVEALEDKVFSSSMQVKGWKPKVKASTDDTMESLESAENAGIKSLDMIKDRLASLEKSVERRYLKAPLSKSNVQINIEKMGKGQEDRSSSPSEDIAKGLAMWRGAVKSAANSSQLKMCLELLEKCIAWEKSIMKVYCQFCRKGDNEELLLLCDGCDKGFHTYCFKPKMSSIPDGDWYCYECIFKATGECICVMCRERGKLVKCDNCPRAYHPDCLDPPLPKLPRGKWLCQWCQKQKNKNSRGKGKKQKAKESKEPPSSSVNSDSKDSTDWMEKFKEDKVNRKQSSKDMAPCRSILADMEKHDDGWPFLVPVDTKQFSTYKKVIKHPMDFHTMKCKLRDAQYRSREEFAGDARLVFSNCEIFNEDDSDVGRAGHSMRRFFEKRWSDLCGDD